MFEECDTCRKKPGSPTLCSGCLNNRKVITDQQAEIEKLKEYEFMYKGLEK